jgi:hypothetical protein
MWQLMDTLLALLLLVVSFQQCLASCAERKSCCPATFSHELCDVVNGGQSCSCHITCRLHGTCCRDYREFCMAGNPVPCEYQPWQQWGSCSTSESCDIGFQTRRREIRQMGNFRSGQSCSYSRMREHRRCGDLACYSYSMATVHNLPQYARDHANFATAVYEFVERVSGNCDNVSRHIYIMCPDDGRCGNKVIGEDQLVDITSGSCVATWKKRTRSVFRRLCTVLENIPCYAFGDQRK